MKNSWTEIDLLFYNLGIKYSDYPKVIWELILKENAEMSSVLDIGSGPGAFSIIALNEGMKVQAVDSNNKHITVLKEKYSDSALLNTYHCDWLEADIDKADVSICSYSLSGSICSLEGVKKILNNTEKTAYFISFQDVNKTDFQTEEVIFRHGFEPRKFESGNDNFFDILCNLDVKYEIKKLNYDFGIPLLEEIPFEYYLNFISSKTGIKDFAVLERHLKNIMIYKKGVKWLPNYKKSILVTWRNN